MILEDLLCYGWIYVDPEHEERVDKLLQEKGLKVTKERRGDFVYYELKGLEG